MRINLAVIVVLCACAGQTKPRTLFARLGGQPAINAVVHQFVATTGADPRIDMLFTNVDVAKLEATMDQHICSITGGGCTYGGKSMLDAHANMHLTGKDFDAFMDDLAKTLAKLAVAKREADEVLGAFQGMQADVVGH